VLSADAFAAFREVGLENSDKLNSLGKKFRNTVLSLGGSQAPLTVFKAFRGKEPDPNSLLVQENLLPLAHV